MEQNHHNGCGFKKIFDEPIVCKFSGVSWYKDEGFITQNTINRREGSILSGMTDTHKVYFHKLGTKQSEDQLIIGGENFKKIYDRREFRMTKDF